MTEDTKPCPVCAETIKVAAIKCRFCNTDLVAFAASKEGESESVLFSGHPVVIFSAWQWLAVLFTLGIAYLYYWVQSLSIAYEVTTQRVRIERGILSKSMVISVRSRFSITRFELFLIRPQARDPRNSPPRP